MSLQFSECHTKIRHVDAHATLSDGVVVQVLGELSNNGQPMRKFMQTFVLAPEVGLPAHCALVASASVLTQLINPASKRAALLNRLRQGSVANKFYVHNDIFRYEDEVFCDSEAELDEGQIFDCNVIALWYGWLAHPCLCHVCSVSA